MKINKGWLSIMGGYYLCLDGTLSEWLSKNGDIHSKKFGKKLVHESAISRSLEKVKSLLGEFELEDNNLLTTTSADGISDKD